jgi:hypothetical protein
MVFSFCVSTIFAMVLSFFVPNMFDEGSNTTMDPHGLACTQISIDAKLKHLISFSKRIMHHLKR